MTQIFLEAKAINSNDVYFCICGIDHSKKTLFFHLILESHPSGDISVLHLGAKRFEIVTEFPRFIEKVKRKVKEMNLDVEIDFDILSPMMDGLKEESIDLIRLVRQETGNPTADEFIENKKTRYGLKHSSGRVCYLEGRWGIKCDRDSRFINAHSISEANNLLPLDGSKRVVFSCWPENNVFVLQESSSRDFSASKYICKNHEMATWEIEREGVAIDINSKDKVIVAIDRTIAYVSSLIDKRKKIEAMYASEFRDNFLYFTDSGALRLDGCDVRSLRGEIECHQLEMSKASIESFYSRGNERLIFSVDLMKDPPVMCNNLIFFEGGFIFLSILRNGGRPIAMIEFSSSELLVDTVDFDIISDSRLFTNFFTFLMVNSRPFFVNTEDPDRLEIFMIFLDISKEILNSIQASRTGISIIEGPLFGRVRACDVIKTLENVGHTKSSTLRFRDSQSYNLKTRDLFRAASESKLISDLVDFLHPEGIIPHPDDLRKLSDLIIAEVRNKRVSNI